MLAIYSKSFKAVSLVKVLKELPSSVLEGVISEVNESKLGTCCRSAVDHIQSYKSRGVKIIHQVYGVYKGEEVTPYDLSEACKSALGYEEVL